MARRQELRPEDLPPGSLVEHETFYYHDPEKLRTEGGDPVGFGEMVTELGEVLQCRRASRPEVSGWFVEVTRGPVKNGRGGPAAWPISEVRKIDVVDALASLAQPKRGGR